MRTREPDILEFEIAPEEWGSSGQLSGQINGMPVDSILIHKNHLGRALVLTLVHEITEREVMILLMEWGHSEQSIQDTYVSHILAPFKAGHWGKWRTFGRKVTGALYAGTPKV